MTTNDLTQMRAVRLGLLLSANDKAIQWSQQPFQTATPVAGLTTATVQRAIFESALVPVHRGQVHCLACGTKVHDACQPLRVVEHNAIVLFGFCVGAAGRASCLEEAKSEAVQRLEILLATDGGGTTLPSKADAKSAQPVPGPLCRSADATPCCVG